jgi:hypothetical protein
MRTFLLLCLTVLMVMTYGQSGINTTTAVQTPVFPWTYNQQDFGDRFSVLHHSDESYDYYAVDLTKLGGEFERVYFMNLTFSDKRIVNLDSDLKKDQTWFKSYYTYKENEITCLFNELKEKTDQARLNMSAAEKEAWMLKNNKYKK